MFRNPYSVSGIFNINDVSGASPTPEFTRLVMQEVIFIIRLLQLGLFFRQLLQKHNVSEDGYAYVIR